MYAIGWITPLFIVAVSAGYGLYFDKYVHPRYPKSEQCQEGQLLYPFVTEGEFSFIFTLLC